jgi:glycosyltransferase involved in cell wall biosynthesis
MGWCITRAIKSCQKQSLPVTQIIVADDASTDNTEYVVRSLMNEDSRISYWRHQTNRGHLYAITTGALQVHCDWAALLDADDELTGTSIEKRIGAATKYYEQTGTMPQLIYGDLLVLPKGAISRFARLSGNAYPFLCSELSLCQTSTIMLGRKSLKLLPLSRSWSADDRIVLAVGKEYEILHSGDVVSVYHCHDAVSRMSNNHRKKFVGVFELVRDHQKEVLHTHGIWRVVLWYLRVLNALLVYQIAVIGRVIESSCDGGVYSRSRWFLSRIYGKLLSIGHSFLDWYLRKHFQSMHF